jgi:hypothetical protein
MDNPDFHREGRAVRFGLYQPFNLQVRLVLWLLWAVIVLAVIGVGSRSPEPNHPVGLLLLGLGLVGPGALALLTLLSRDLWERLVDPEYDVQKARLHFHGLAGLGLVGLLLIGFALERLL